jgi:hypothetical protein
MYIVQRRKFPVQGSRHGGYVIGFPVRGSRHGGCLTGFLEQGFRHAAV